MESRKLVRVTIWVFSVGATLMTLLSSITAMKPSTNQGIGGALREPVAPRVLRAANNPSPITMGASIITRVSFATVPN